MQPDAEKVGQKCFTVLIVDDQPKTLVALEAGLASPDLRLITALSGEEALRVLLHETVDLILLDVRMAGMDGLETAKMIRARQRISHIPIIMMSAIDKDDTQVFQGYQEGAVDYVFKPIDPKVLRAKISVFVELYRTTQKLRESEADILRINNELAEMNIELSRIVEERTAALQQTNDSLREEISVRRAAENTVHDLNEALLKNLEKLEAANNELEAFSYSISHDLRAPVRHIQSFLQILHQDHAAELSDTAADYVNRVIAAAAGLSSMIHSLLDLSKLGNAEIVETEVNLSEIAQQTAAELQCDAAHRRTEFIIAPHVTVRGSQDLLKIVMGNLLGNAWKFASKRESPRIEFGVQEVDDDRTYFVRDNGVGFDPRLATGLFQPFKRLHHDQDFPGTGVGLATVHRIVSRHGGRIWAESEPDTGATFYFTLA